jgi:Outer membrane protein beta-barrel domain
MRHSLLGFALIAALGTVAAAQTPPGDQTGTGTTDVTPMPQPPPPQPPPPQPPVEHAAPAHPADSAVRPHELAFAIGLGYLRPVGGSIDLQTPNIASARLRLISGLTFEPTISIANSSTDSDNAGTQMTDTTTEFGLGTLVRLPVIKHGRVDFEVLGSLGFDVLKVNPDGDYNTTTTTSLSLGWGIGIGYWIGQHWQLSASATNPLVGYQQNKQQTGPSTDVKTGTTTFGVTFDPAIFVMVHLYN